MRSVQQIRVDAIESSPGRRAVDGEAVARLMESINRIGLRTPISVRVVDDYRSADGEVVDGQPILVTGAHRLEAVRRLGWEKVECFIFDGETEAQARMWEIAENLHRAELTELERSENVTEWIRLADEESQRVLLQSETKPKSGPKGGRPKAGVRAASRDLGIDSTAAHRAVKVASLTDDAKQAAREVGLDDNRSALLAASRAAPDQQEEVIRKIADDKAERALLKPAKAVSLTKLINDATSLPEWTAEHEASYAALCDAWEAAPHDARMQFLTWLPARYRSAA